MKKTKVFVLLLFVCLYLAPSFAQTGRVAFAKEEVTVEELIQTIHNQTGYSFAFTYGTLNLLMPIKIEAQGYAVRDVLEVLMKETNCQYLVKKRFIVVTPSLKEKDPLIYDAELNDTYIPSDGLSIDKEQPDAPYYVLPDSIALEEYVYLEVPQKEWDAPYSSLYDLEVYHTMKNKLPRYAFSVNAIQLATLTPNISAEVALSARGTIELSAACFPWKKSGKPHKSKVYYHMWIAEYKHWLNERFNGHYIGGHLLYAGYDIKGCPVPLLFRKHNGYKGNAFGGGISYGYHLPLSTRWGMEFTAGIGVARLSYDKFSKGVTTKKVDTYVGPTQLGVNFVYILK